MAQFNPDAATQAWLATLPQAEHVRAISYTQGGHWLLLWGTLIAIATAWIILRTGLLKRVSERVTAKKPRRNLAVFLCALVFLAIDWVIELPWAVYSDWWREKSYGLTKQAFGGWLTENIMANLINALLVGLLAMAIYALIRRSPRFWWAWSGLVAAVAIIFLIVLSPVVIEPLFNNYEQAPPGPTRDAVVALAERAGVPHDKILIYDGSRQSERYTANVSGLFGTARIAMSDTMAQQGADLEEVRAVVGHEMGHYAEAHSLWLAAAVSVLAVLLFWLVARFYRPAAGAMGAGDDIADPANMPVIVAVTAVAALLLGPVMNSISRYDENAADRFSLAHAHEPDGLAKALVKTIAYRASSPSRLEEVLFYDHPSVERRIHAAMVWKAENPELVGK